jgi:hypothetical protein
VQILSAQLEPSDGVATQDSNVYTELTADTTTEAPLEGRACNDNEFLCTGVTTYKSCDAVKQRTIQNQCPRGSFCNTKCANPCTNDIRLCWKETLLPKESKEIKQLCWSLVLNLSSRTFWKPTNASTLATYCYVSERVIFIEADTRDLNYSYDLRHIYYMYKTLLAVQTNDC